MKKHSNNKSLSPKDKIEINKLLKNCKNSIEEEIRLCSELDVELENDIKNGILNF